MKNTLALPLFHNLRVRDGFRCLHNYSGRQKDFAMKTGGERHGNKAGCGFADF